MSQTKTPTKQRFMFSLSESQKALVGKIELQLELNELKESLLARQAKKQKLQ